MGILAGIGSMLGWGTADFLGAISSRKIGNVLSLFWMQVVGFLVASIYFIINFSSFNSSDISKFLLTIIIVALLQSISYLSFYKGLEIGKVALVSPIGASWGMITAILSFIFFKEVLRFNQAIAVLLIMIGVILISINIKDILEAKRLKVFTGVKEGIIAMLGFGISLFLIVPASREIGWFLPVFLFRFFMITFLASFIIFKRVSFKFKPEKNILLALIPIGLLDVFAFLSYSFGVNGTFASVVAPIAGTFPLITIFLARIFLKEKITSIQTFGIVGIILGLILISL